MRPSTRTVALLAIAGAGLVLAVWSWTTSRSSEPQVRFIPVGSTDEPTPVGADGVKPNPEHGPEVSARSRLRGDDEVDYISRLPPPTGRTFWVRPARPESDSGERDGSRDAPWLGLEPNLKSLQSGDRLVLGPGRYRGPILLPPNMGDEPIEIVGNPGIVMYNIDDANAPVISANGGWSLIGFEIHPGPTSVGVAIAGERTILRHLHIQSGGREGIVVHDTARAATIFRSHVHHVGGPEGVGIRIESGALEIRLERNKVHGVDAHEIVLFEPGEFEQRATGRKGSRQLELPEFGIFILEDPWEP